MNVSTLIDRAPSDDETSRHEESPDEPPDECADELGPEQVGNEAIMDLSTVFDRSAAWRVEIIKEFRLRGAERCAAASPSPGFPQILDSILGVLNQAPDGPWIDLGAGLGGASSWVERTTHRKVGLYDRSMTSLLAARCLFDDLSATRADVACLPIPGRAVSVALVSGLVSLLDDVDPLLMEAERVLFEGGFMAVTDLWSAGADTKTVGVNTFRSFEDFCERASRRGLELAHVAVADVSTGWWSSAAEQINDEIDTRFRCAEGYAAWKADQEHLVSVLDDQIVIAAGLVFAHNANSYSPPIR